jgi:hypothetical protein
MYIKRRDDEMQTRGRFARPQHPRWADEGAVQMTCYEVESRMWRLLDEAACERLIARRPGLREHVGRALIAIGMSISGSEPAPRSRSPLPVR